MKKIVTTYSLEMLNKSDFNPKPGFEKQLEIKEISKNIFINWMLFTGVGLPWKWYSRLKWSREEWEAYFAGTDSRTFLAFRDKELVGYYELEIQHQQMAEIKFFGLFPQYIGDKLGGHLLSHAVQTAWKSGVNRIWLHTCTSDHELALSNYQARGFKIFREAMEEEEIPDTEEFLLMIQRFFRDYITLNMQTAGQIGS